MTPELGGALLPDFADRRGLPGRLTRRSSGLSSSCILLTVTGDNLVPELVSSAADMSVDAFCRLDIG